MIKNKIKIFLTSIVLVSILLITYFTFDSNIRRYLYTKSIGGYKLYQSHIISSHVFYRDFDSASKQILNYIEFSQKFSKGKNSMLQGILDVTELVTSKAYTQEEFNILENVYIRINEITEDIYKNHVWLARALSDDDLEKSIIHLKKALRLSNSSEEAYREIIRIFSENKKFINLMNDYCKNYLNNFEGGTIGRIGAQDDVKFLFGGSSVFAISRDENYSTVNQRLLHSELNKYHNYDFIFEDAKDINQFNLIKSFFSGSKVFIRNISLYNDIKNEINLDNLVTHSFSSYILDQSSEEIVFINVNDDDDIIKFIFDKIYKDINKISLDLKIEKLPLVNKSVCKNLNEN
tara:strand:+ start:1363 stop:2406 length:1044 start_codon:yes stop_codon:yes gene_type:complete